MTSINSLIHGNGALEIRMIPNPEKAKSDSALLLMHGAEQLDIYLIDGGHANKCTLEALLALRRRLLKEAALEDIPENRLHLTLLITHCHVDHVETLYEEILPEPCFAVDAVYLPPATALTTDGTYSNLRNGDVYRRSLLLKAILDYSPETPIHMLRFGELRELPLPGGRIQLFAPLSDWGEPSGLSYILKYYFADKPEKVYPNVPVRVVNCNTMWIRAEIGEHSMLFPGDAVKVLTDRDDEPMDRTIAAYGKLMISDIVKYPHHGVGRNPAAANTASLLKPGGMAVLAAGLADSEAAIALDAIGIPHVNVADGTQIFVLTQESVQYIAP